ncbi:MAG: response regulator transcription factor [Micropruina sp.]|nr:response regulator transcription factor [Micropruina sp.]
MKRVAPAPTLAGPGTAAVRVLVIDDHRVFTELLSLALDASPGTRCVAVAGSIREGLAKAAAHPFDVVVIDVRLPDGNGLDAVPQLLALHPGARILLLTAHPRADLAEWALRSGASGFLAKEEPLAHLLRAIEDARPGRPAISSALPVAPADAIGLTPREREVLTLLAQGHDSAAIARLLWLSRHTVRDHVKAVLTKLDAHTQLAAVVKATALGLIDPWPG